MNRENKEYKFNIISFSGRKESGKTELANICVNAGYEKKSFATALKLLVCKLTGCESVDKLNTFKNKPMGVNVDASILEMLSHETEIDYDYCSNKCGKLTEFSTARDWLQVIGTDVIRSCDPNWHVRNTLSTLEDGKKYVFDDTRFPNELEALKGMGAECWFIIRNKTDNISNHDSETSLDYRMFDYHIIVNNVNLEDLRKRWKFYMECHDVTAPMREWGIAQLFMNRYVPLAENTLNKFFVYSEFVDFKNRKQPPQEIIENDKRNGFVGDNENPFITEDWKRYYNKKVQN